jgi:DedD protein
MRGAFDDEEPAPAKPRRDTELTLGSGALLGLLLGLALLCAFCFGLGYAVGHRGSASASAALPAPSQPIAASNSLAKPPATTQAEQAQSADTEDPGQPPGGAAPAPANTAPRGPALPSAAPVAEQPAQQPSVHPALPYAAPGSSAQAAPASGVQPVMEQAPPPGSLMVQIAAVSQAEDATVLINALRKRGYVVTARRDPADNLIHVRIGPFATLAEANSWRMKLLSDGYNAIVEP